MNELKFLGIGSAFNLKDDNNSAYFINDDTFVLFDCGDRIARKIINYNLLDNINKVIIVITHLHADHVSSLETLIDYIRIFKKDCDLKVIYPKSENLLTLLRLEATYEPLQVYGGNLFDFFDIKIKAIEATHIPYSYSYFVKTNDFSFYYSGDTSKVSNEAVEMLYDGKLDRIYHEVALYDIPVHTYLPNLVNAIKPEYRKKVIVMHLADEKTKEEALKEGFVIAKQEF